MSVFLLKTLDIADAKSQKINMEPVFQCDKRHLKRHTHTDTGDRSPTLSCSASHLVPVWVSSVFLFSH